MVVDSTSEWYGLGRVRRPLRNDEVLVIVKREVSREEALGLRKGLYRRCIEIYRAEKGGSKRVFFLKQVNNY